MPTIVQGLFFAGKDRPSRPLASTSLTDARQFVLKLRLVDNQGAHKVEPWIAQWVGDEAEQWWKANAPVKPGDPLVLTLENPRAMTSGGDVAPSIHAHIRSCRRAPRAHSAAPNNETA